MKTFAALARATVALVLLAVLAVGVPVLLASFGNPVTAVLDAFSDPLASDTRQAGELLTSVLVGIGWACWAMTVVSIVVETTAIARGRFARRLPFLPGIQTAVARLVAAVSLAGTLLGAAPAAALPLPPAPIEQPAVKVTVSPLTLSSAVQPVSARSGPTYVVARSDTFWSIAERFLGDGSRWHEIVDTNAGTVMADGTRFDASTTRPQPGWILSLPAGATGTGAGPAPDEPEPPAPAPSPADVGDVVHVVTQGDRIWDLAEDYLGTDTNRATAEAAQAIADANLGRPQSDGRAMTDPNWLEPGWELVIPTTASTRGPVTVEGGGPADGGPVRSVVVERGDTLWDLAETHLGDGHRYCEIVDANLDRPQIDGRALTDPSVIEPGWTLVIPEPETPPGVDASPPAPTTAGIPLAPVVAAPVPDTTPPAPELELADPVPSPASPTTTLVPPVADLPAVPATTAPAHTAPGDPIDVDVDATDRGPVLPVGLAAVGIATAGVVAVLERRRRVQRQRRRPGHVLPAPPARLATAETELRAGAAVDRADLVASALRAAAAGAGLAGLPPLRYVQVDDDHVRIHLAEQIPAPPGFTATGQVWETDLPAEALEKLSGGLLDPLPLLCPIGATANGSDVLIDLEAAGVVTITGTTGPAGNLLRAMTLALATSPWTTSRVVLVDLDGQITDLEWVEAAPDLSTALHAAAAHAAGTARSVTDAGARSTADARAAGAAMDACEPLVVVSTTPAWEAHTQQLHDLADAAPSATAVIVAASTDTPATDRVRAGSALVVADDGTVTFTGIDIAVHAAGLSSDDIRVVGELLTEAAQQGTDIPAPTTPPAGVRPRPAERSVGIDMSGIDVLVRVMGDVTIERLNDDPSEIEFGRAKAREAVVYLAAGDRGSGVSMETVEAALWPAGTNSIRTMNNTMSDARKGLGPIADTPDLYLPAARDRRYRLSDLVVTDFEVFWTFRHQADQTDDPVAAAALLDQALGLVRGEPFLGAGRDFAWASPIRTTVIVAIVDVADELGEIRLTAGDHRGAERAARAGLTAAPGEERLYRILMRAAATAGSNAMVERVYRELNDVLADPDDGIEPEATITTETIQLFNQLLDRPGERHTA